MNRPAFSPLPYAARKLANVGPTPSVVTRLCHSRNASGTSAIHATAASETPITIHFASTRTRSGLASVMPVVMAGMMMVVMVVIVIVIVIMVMAVAMMMIMRMMMITVM